MPDTPIIQIEKLSHIYPNGVQALRDVTLDIRQGEYLAIVGQNGSGKTTLAKHLNGLLKPTQGVVRVSGKDTRQERVSSLSLMVGYVFQNPDDMIFSSSVEDEIAFGPKMMGYSAEETKHRVEASLERLGLVSLRDQHPFVLSLGDRQRVAIACVLALEPPVFVFDEPTTGQDYFGGESIMATIDQLHADGFTIVMITHDMQLVARHAHRVVVMNKAQVALDAPPAQAFSQIDLLESLSLRPPQVTRLAYALGCPGQAVLGVSEFCDWVEAQSRKPAEPIPS